ncbi:MAG: hypothetical protein ACI8T1_003888 [Verrucomicrobiales bacterium]|jgi:hypothetical protein
MKDFIGFSVANQKVVSMMVVLVRLAGGSRDLRPHFVVFILFLETTTFPLVKFFTSI